MKIIMQALLDFKSIGEAIDYALENGFDGVEIGLSNPYFYKEFIERGIDSPVPILIHSIDGFDLSTPIVEVREAGWQWLQRMVERAQSYGVRVYTIHLGTGIPFAYTGRKIFLQEEFPAFFSKPLEEMISQLSRYSIIAVENVGIFRFGFVRELIQRYLSEGLKLTWDIGHTFLLKDGREEESFFLKNRESIVNIHLHDNYGQRDEHNVIGDGKIDFRRILSYFRDWDGYFTIEVRPKEKAVESLHRLRDMWE
ncbi:hypothetical protein DRP53_04665 [candidate division WOR-3 bacterium]|uniref:Xylose isomerase-like TIM barrel domain-containing protein n=1 Tax=candidate division WOR-3 bacterium TaxID=2052148 RepID=A0A660SIG6_UNCW3|nr:MAG: hypothetical protein DRP53_04665 [candidate division WOR-3 bacterium]